MARGRWNCRGTKRRSSRLRSVSVDISEAASDVDARPIPVALDTIEPPVALEEDLSVGPGNVAGSGEAPIARKRTRTTVARAPRKAVAPRATAEPRAPQGCAQAVAATEREERATEGTRIRHGGTEREF